MISVVVWWGYRETPTGENNMTHLVLNKETKKFFAGFTVSGAVKWSAKSNASKMTMQEAKVQAALLICNDIPAQRKPVAA